jgi:hypothetical protein
MRLNFQGHRQRPQVNHIGEAPSRPAYGDSNGWFYHNGTYYDDGNALSVTFRPEIRIVNGLDTAAEASVLTHEQRHRTDFMREAERLRTALRRAVRSGDHQIDLRWEWFNYDLNEAANQFHRQSGQGDIRVNIQPGRPRPE